MAEVCLVFDIETDSLFADFSSRDEALDRMQMTVACAVEIPIAKSGDLLLSDAVEHTIWRDAPGDVERLLDLLLRARFVVAYNGAQFDLPVLKKYNRKIYFELTAKLWDPLAQLNLVLGFRPKLDDLLKQNGLAQKTGDGVNAVRLFADGKRAQLAAYCLDDVRALVELCTLATLRVDGLTLPPTAFSLAAAARLFAVHTPNPACGIYGLEMRNVRNFSATASDLKAACLDGELRENAGVVELSGRGSG
jgi:hypothetical protein